ncbi:Serine/arginine repetitive matrix protein 2 [Gigaspora margarita]|uniref:RBR-type E3 ubiquitin transferase n=1 Tax=Gigaspora margarita TaxID=4874 RepID=A0A8H4A9I7_GIGMA|nr:Serine/arginine repetitive matrix protein 2 [Gigaspora margarita]
MEEECKIQKEELRQANGRNAESASESYVGQLKQCPNCSSRIKKNEGCDHMTCRCGHQFCWICMNEWDKPHKSSCSFYV